MSKEVELALMPIQEISGEDWNSPVIQALEDLGFVGKIEILDLGDIKDILWVPEKLRVSLGAVDKINFEELLEKLSIFSSVELHTSSNSIQFWIGEV